MQKNNMGLYWCGLFFQKAIYTEQFGVARPSAGKAFQAPFLQINYGRGDVKPTHPFEHRSKRYKMTRGCTFDLLTSINGAHPSKTVNALGALCSRAEYMPENLCLTLASEHFETELNSLAEAYL